MYISLESSIMSPRISIIIFLVQQLFGVTLDVSNGAPLILQIFPIILDVEV